MRSSLPYPLLFEPFLRPMPWGCRRLGDWLGTSLPHDTPIGEAWLLSDHPIHVSRVANGPLAGWTLRQLMEEHGEDLLGHHAERFPLLVKLLDVENRLSIQVHPDDADAVKWAPSEGGKTEAWLILEAKPDAAVYLGLKPGVDKATLMRELAVGAGHLCLRRYEPRPGECYFVPAGTVHAMAGGIVALEVQQTSDATFRLYDWGRVDAEGKPRPLHIEAGLACLKEQTPGAGLQTAKRSNEHGELLVACDYFRLHRLSGPATVSIDDPCILVGLGGEAYLGEGPSQTALRRGMTVLLPASFSACKLQIEENSVVASIGVAAASLH